MSLIFLREGGRRVVELTKSGKKTRFRTRRAFQIFQNLHTQLSASVHFVAPVKIA